MNLNSVMQSNTWMPNALLDGDSSNQRPTQDDKVTIARSLDVPAEPDAAATQYSSNLPREN